MQAEDFPEGYPASAFVVYQISAQVGRGFDGRFDFPDAPQLTTLGETIAEGQAGGGTSNFPADTVMAQRYDGVSGQVLSASAYLGSSASGDTRMGLYADDAGEPGALIAATEAKAFTATGSGHWEELEFTSPPTTVGGAKYWLACHADASVNSRGSDGTNQNDARRLIAQSYVTYDVAGATVEDNTLWGGKCILFDNGPRLRVDDDPAIENADRITIEAWVNTLSWPTRAVVCRKDGSYILYNFEGGFSWYLFGPDNRLQHDIAGMLGNGAWGYIVGTYDKDAGADNQRLYLNGARVAQMSDTLPIDLNSAALGIGRHVSGIADPFNGHIDEFRIAHVQRSDGWIATTWNNMSDPGAFAEAGGRGAGSGEPPPLVGTGVVVCLIA